MHRLILDEVEQWTAETSQQYLNKLYKAVFSAAYYGLLRIGELTFSQHCLLARNVHIGKNKEKLLFIFNSSKTHSKGQKPQLIKIASTPLPAAVKDRSKISKNTARIH